MSTKSFALDDDSFVVVIGSGAGGGTLSAELTRLGKAHTFHRYDGAGHAFQNFVRPEQYREAAEKDSWGKTLDFLNTALA